MDTLLHACTAQALLWRVHVLPGMCSDRHAYDRSMSQAWLLCISCCQHDQQCMPLAVVGLVCNAGGGLLCESADLRVNQLQETGCRILVPSEVCAQALQDRIGGEDAGWSCALHASRSQEELLPLHAFRHASRLVEGSANPLPARTMLDSRTACLHALAGSCPYCVTHGAGAGGW